MTTNWSTTRYALGISCMLSLTGTHAAAVELGKGFTCQAASSPERVVLAFRDKGFIEKTAYSNVDAVQSFAAQPGHTVFGLPFVALVAWEEGSKFFGRGPGTSPGTQFSLVVQANQWQLDQAVRKNGVKVTKGRGAPQYPETRVSGFNSENQDDLPKRADGRFAYAQIICRPKP